MSIPQKVLIFINAVFVGRSQLSAIGFAAVTCVAMPGNAVSLKNNLRPCCSAASQ